MALHTSLVNLTPEERDQIRDVRARFERAVQKDPPPELGKFLPPPGHRIRLTLLCELIELDMGARWRNRLPVFIEEYLDRFPELRNNRAAIVDLIGIEYRIRLENGEGCELVDYRARFPNEYADLHRNITTPSSSDMAPPVQRTSVVSRSDVVPAPAKAGMPVAAPGVTLPIGGGYLLVERIGSGGFGDVWKAEAPGGVDAAIKIIFRPLDHADAQSELEALELVKKLHHPFLLQTHSFYALEDRLLIVMELAEGSLRTRLRQCTGAGLPGIPAAELIRHFAEACEAIDFLHEKHVLHRDVKPDNMLLVAGHIKLCDFGLARMLPSAQSLRVTGMSGTPGYMAPEAWRGRPGPRSDQYALAAAYVELRLNRPLFPGKDFFETMVNHTEREPDLSALPTPEREVLLRALAKQPKVRFATCLEFAEALRVAKEPSRPAQLPIDGEDTPDIDLGDGTAGGNSPTQIDGGTSLIAGTQHRRRRSTPKNTSLVEEPKLGTTGTPTTKPEPPPWPWKRWVIGAGAGLVLVGAVVALTLIPWSKGTPPEPSGGKQLPLPTGFTRAENANIIEVEGREIYDRIVRVTSGGLRVELVLVPQMRANEERPFYMMKTKVWNRLYDEFARHAEQQGRPVGSEWKKGAVLKKEEVPADSNPDYPVLRITLEEAHRFAIWLGGEVPRARQWDQASGRFIRPQIMALGCLVSGYLLTPDANRLGDPEPFVWPESENPEYYALDGPRRVGEASRDVSPSGCRDVAGNGWEWTRNVYDEEKMTEERLVNFESLNQVAIVSLRSHRYLSSGKPYKFGDSFDFRPPDVRSPDITFRVAIDLDTFLAQVK